MNRPVDRDYECYDFNDESDQEPYDSSDDDIDVILHGTPEQKRKLQNRVRSTSVSSSEDDFEKEMNDELNRQIDKIKHEHQPDKIAAVNDTCNPGTSLINTEAANDNKKFYDDVYFDSDEEEMVLQGDERVRRRQEVVSNEDLLYDPKLDEEDEKWMNSQRKSYQSSDKTNKAPSSDAVLNCPACMTLLCLDCQRHSTYQNQYRAMFVFNCKVDTSELLKHPLKKKKKKKQKADTTEEDPTDNFHPVKCTECSTVVGVYDHEEIYHFFNILASHS